MGPASSPSILLLFLGSQNLPGRFPSPSAVQGSGVASHHVPSSNWWWCLTQIGCNPNSLLYGIAWPPCCWIGATPGAEGGKSAFLRDWAVPEVVPSGYRDKQWILELSCVFCKQRRLKAEHNLTLQGFSQTPSGFRCRFCWRKGRCLSRDLLPGGCFAFSLEALVAPQPSSAASIFKFGVASGFPGREVWWHQPCSCQELKVTSPVPTEWAHGQSHTGPEASRTPLLGQINQVKIAQPDGSLEWLNTLIHLFEKRYWLVQWNR